MATYKGIKGFTIQTIAGDPPAPAQGQVWYNTTSNVLKGYLTVTGAWSSGGALNTPRNGSAGAGISQDSALCIAGTSGPTLQNQAELYDGSTWTEVSNLVGDARYSLGGLGTVTAAMALTGYADSATLPTQVEEYDGSSWTEVTGTPIGKINIVQAGTTAAAIIGGGQAPPIWVLLNTTNTWNGSTWTEVNNMVVPQAGAASFGTSTAAIAAGGVVSGWGKVDSTEVWDGTSWTEVNDTNQARNLSTGCGTSTDGMICGGAISPSPPTNAFSALTEKWDGTSWTEVGDMGQGRYDQGQAVNSPSGNSAIWGGSGNGIPYSNVCEEWNDPVYAIKTVTTS